MVYILRTIIPQRLSTGLRSGEQVGHFNTSMWLAENHWEVEKLAWMLALSSWKVYFFRQNLLRNGNKCVSNTLMKSLLFILMKWKKVEEFLGLRNHIMPKHFHQQNISWWNTVFLSLDLSNSVQIQQPHPDYFFTTLNMICTIKIKIHKVWYILCKWLTKREKCEPYSTLCSCYF